MFKYNTELLDEISALPIVNDLVTIQDMMRWGYSYFNASESLLRARLR